MRQANCPMFPIHRMLIFPTFFFFCLNRHFLIPFVPFAVQCLVAQSCPTLCDPRDCSLPGSSVHGDSPGKNTGVGCRALLQGIFPAQGLNPGLPNCRQFLYHLSEEGSPLFPLAVIFFLRFFFFFGWGPFLKPLLNLLHYCFMVSCFVSLALRHVGSWLLEQGSNAPPYLEKSWPLDHYRSPLLVVSDVPRLIFILLVMILKFLPTT